MIKKFKVRKYGNAFPKARLKLIRKLVDILGTDVHVLENPQLDSKIFFPF